MFFPMLAQSGISKTRVGLAHATVTSHYIGPHAVPKWLSTVDYVRKTSISSQEDEYWEEDIGMVECSEIDMRSNTYVWERR